MGSKGIMGRLLMKKARFYRALSPVKFSSLFFLIESVFYFLKYLNWFIVF